MADFSPKWGTFFLVGLVIARNLGAKQNRTFENFQIKKMSGVQPDIFFVDLLQRFRGFGLTRLSHPRNYWLVT